MSARPATWLVGHQHLLPPRGVVLDLACGRGRHALWLAQRGLDVVAMDRDEEAIAALAHAAQRLDLPVQACVVDLERGDVRLEQERFDAVVVFNYLHRPLFPQIVSAVRRGGVLVAETFTRDQALRGRPRNPDYLLEPGELRRLVAPLTVVAAREGEFEGRCVASIVAQKRTAALRGVVSP